MKKTQIVKEIIGKKLKDYGFVYKKKDGVQWVFEREIPYKRVYDPNHNFVKQYVMIQEHRYANELAMHFWTNVLLNRFLGKELDILKEFNPDGKNQWFQYSGEKEYRQVLELFGDLAVKYGIDFLNQMSDENEIIPTKLMDAELYENHKILDESFLKRYQINPIPEELSDIDDWFLKIKEIIFDLAKRPYEEAKSLLIEIAAFIGERNCELLDSKWFYDEERSIIRTDGENYRGRCCYPLLMVVRCYGIFRDNGEVDGILFNEIDALKSAVKQKNGLNEIIDFPILPGQKIIRIGGYMASYKHIERELSMDYFYGLESDTSYEEVVNSIGEPNGEIYFGDSQPYYEVGKQYVVIMFSIDADGNRDYIVAMGVYNQKSCVKVIPVR